MTWVEVFAAGLIGAVIASIFWVMFNTYRIQDLMLQCEEEKQVLREEVDTAAKMVAKTEMQSRVLGATPVSKLIGGIDETRS